MQSSSTEKKPSLTLLSIQVTTACQKKNVFRAWQIVSALIMFIQVLTT